MRKCKLLVRKDLHFAATPAFTLNIFFLPLTILNIRSFAHTYIHSTAHELTHPHTCARAKCILIVWENVRKYLHSITNNLIFIKLLNGAH